MTRPIPSAWPNIEAEKVYDFGDAMTHPATRQTIATRRGDRSVHVEKRVLAKREKLQASRQSPKSRRSAAKSGDLAIPAAERNPWASAGVCRGLNDMAEKGDL